MMKSVIRTGLALALAAAASIWGFTAATDASAYDRQSNRGNGVRVDVLPVALEKGKPVRLEVRLNTHSVELDQDLAAVSSLDVGGGTVLQPDRWEGSPPGGHHRSGILHFGSLPPNAEEIVFTIRNVGGVPERTFRWRVE